jgi:hypothetical protein
MREELRVQTERKTQATLKRSALFPLTTLDGYDANVVAARARNALHRRLATSTALHSTASRRVWPRG